MWSFIKATYSKTSDALLCDEVASQVVKALELDKKFVVNVGLKVLQNIDATIGFFFQKEVETPQSPLRKI